VGHVKGEPKEPALRATFDVHDQRRPAQTLPKCRSREIGSAQGLACCTAGAQPRPSATGIWGMSASVQEPGVGCLTVGEKAIVVALPSFAWSGMLACTIGGAAIAEIQGLMHSFGRVVIVLALLSGMIATPAVAQSPAPAASDNPPAQVRELLELLDDPAVRDWLATRRNADHPPAAAPPRAGVPSGVARHEDRDRPQARSMPTASGSPSRPCRSPAATRRRPPSWPGKGWS
jgi:hypothetical protein